MDVDAALSSRRLVLRDARKTLASFLVDGKPDWQRFQGEIGGLLSSVPTPDGVPVRAYGEMVDLLWRDGESKEAIRLEEFWNDLHHTHSFDLLCAYVMGNFDKEASRQDFDEVCALHSRAAPAESYPRDADADARLAEVSRLQQRARALEHEIELRKELERGLRVALDERRRAEEALGASQEGLVDFLENAAEGMHWVGPMGRWSGRTAPSTRCSGMPETSTSAMPSRNSMWTRPSSRTSSGGFCATRRCAFARPVCVARTAR